MKNLIDHPLYQEDLKRIASASFIPWEALENKSLLISGATGMIGSCLIDALLFRNHEFGLNCSIYAIARNTNKASLRFEGWSRLSDLHFIEADVNEPIPLPSGFSCNYVLHLASNTHPVAYATDPIGTITTNIIGTKNMLDLAVKSSAMRFLFASSNEIYGENRGDTELFDESYLGYLDCNTLRAGYPESKRCGEALCQAYLKQFGLECVIARLTRSFGPSLKPTDTKALSQFINNAINREDIVLKSAGNQYYSYTYVADAVSGLLTTMLKGQSGDAYNIADASCDITLKELASIIAEKVDKNVIFELPNCIESAGFSKVTKARLDGRKLKDLGWQLLFSLPDAVERTLLILDYLIYGR